MAGTGSVGEFFKNLGTDLGNSVLGNIEKAKLYIYNVTGAEKIDSRSVVDSTAQALAGASSAAVSSAVSAATSALAAGGRNVNTHVMTVQYNPSTLAIQANADAIPFTYLQQNIDNGIPNQNLRPPMVMLSVELIFDAVNTQDAFMLDKLRLSAGSIISDAAGGIKAASGGYSVQAQTNGLLATVMRPSTKTVTFAWADMAFTGQITEIQARYTMFSPSGKPVRSVVNLNIAQQVESASDSSYWENALDGAFEDSGTMNTKKLGQNLENVLNLNMF